MVGPGKSWPFLPVICILLSFYAVALSAAQSQSPPSVEVFSRLPLVEDVRLSPDGQHLAYVMNLESLSVLTTQTIGVDEHVPILRFDSDMRLTWFRWANDRRILLGGTFPAKRDGVDTTESRLVSINRNGTGLRILNSPSPSNRYQSQTQDNVVSFLPDDPEHVLVALDRDRPGYPSVFRVNVATGRSKRVHAHRVPVRDWMTDQQDRVRIAFGLEDGVSSVRYRDLERSKWIELWSYEEINDPPVSVMGFDLDPNVLYVRALHQGFFSVFKIDLLDPERRMELLMHDPHRDVEGDLIYSRATRDVIGIRHWGEDDRMEYWDTAVEELQDSVNAALPDTANVLTDFSRDERRYIAFAVGDKKPGVYYYGNRETGRLHVFSETYPELKTYELSGKEAIAYESRDGMTIEGYLTRPWGRPPRPWPTVILPHGGPSARDYETFDYWTEFLASRGYAVLQMNFRSSAGFGRKFLEAGFGQWGLAMQDDVTDAAQWVVERGVADPDRLAIYGGSYGGYATLSGVTKTPDLYACAISYVGVSNLFTWIESIPPYWKPYLEMVHEMVGHPERDEKRFRENSPFFNADRIQVPLFVAQGANDPRVPQRESDQIVEALRQRGIDVEYMVKDNEGHGFHNEENRFDFYRAMERFLDRYLRPS